MANKNKRCGKPDRHIPHWWDRRDVNGEVDQWWCDGKPPNPNLVED